MNITKEETGNLTATIQIDLQKADYEPEVQKVLKDYQKKANIPGFRPGKVPQGMIRKMFGKSVMAEEIQKLLSKSLSDYITDNKLRMLGQPLPNTEKSPIPDFEQDENFTFFFDIGLAPEVNLEIGDKIKAEYIEIETDDKTIDKYIQDVRMRHGKTEEVETAEENDILHGKLVAVDPEGNPKEGEEQQEKTISLKYLDNKNEKEKFVGLKIGEKIVFNPLKAAGSRKEASYITGLNEDDDKLDSDFSFEVDKIYCIVPADLNEDLYEKIYPKKDIKTEEEFRNEVIAETRSVFTRETDKIFLNNTMEKLIEEAGMELPDEFLKRWIKENHESDHEQEHNHEHTDEFYEHEYEHYKKALQWQLIENKIVMDNGIRVNEEEIRAYIRQNLVAQLGGMVMDPELEKRVDNYVNTVLQNEKEVEKAYDILQSEKLVEFLKTHLKIKTKKVSYDDYIKTASNHKH
ncbi:MAG: trigger factor [Bacteroidetes bacterium]|nr:trigger factor [Bacteroidota bacterium]